jgi:DNA mismatch endonuclease (patch repair protein)
MNEVNARRSALMARVRGKDTKPEMTVRRAVYALGHRYRLHRRGLPGSPDLVFASQRKAIFVHGCFWHRHKGCRRTTTPKTRVRFWKSKFDANIDRDLKNVAALQAAGWKVLIIWECEAIDVAALRARLKLFLRKGSRAREIRTSS